MHNALILLMLLFVLVLQPYATQAGDEATCQAYTAEAVSAAKEVRDRGCGRASNRNGLDLGHPQWSTNPLHHSDWCLGASQESIDHERAERKRQSLICETCAGYASEALAGAKEVRDRSCNITYDVKHPLWSEDRLVHMEWCMGAKGESIRHERREREAQVNKCRICDGYAAEAHDAAKKVRQLSCGYDLKHGQWSEINARHLDWCLKSAPDSIDHETDQRRRKVEFCATCRKYSNQAMETIRSAKQNACTTSGGRRWSDDEKVHFGWCMSLEEARDWGRPWSHVTGGEQGAREHELGSCLVNLSKQPLVTLPREPSAKTKKKVPRAQGAAATNPVNTARRRGGGSSGVDTVKSSDIKRCKPGQANDPCKPKSRMVSPGLLDGDRGFGGVGPAAAGAAGGGSAGSAAAGPGGGVGVSTFRGSSGMIAPPAGGGVR
jgi:hypothetical protein